MGFREEEKKRLSALKSSLFSERAARDGEYNGISRGFCIHDKFSGENLHDSIRKEAIEYFKTRKIPWHDGKEKRTLPSNHLCCSQSACVNAWFPFAKDPEKLGKVLKELDYDVAEVLPMTLDGEMTDGSKPFLSFEWIGDKNYLRELSRGKVASDEGRKRGAGFTSSDFAFRFRQSDGKVRIVLGEWKYTERYPKGKSMRYAGSGKDRLDGIYRPYLEKNGCQIKMEEEQFPDLFFDPFDQLMRLQLLATEMEREGEMGADIVSTMHVAPAGNLELLDRVTSPVLAGFGEDIHSIWSNLTQEDRFVGVTYKKLLPILAGHAPDSGWGTYLLNRYLP